MCHDGHGAVDVNLLLSHLFHDTRLFWDEWNEWDEMQDHAF